MNTLFLHHRYEELPPRDLSGNGNNGTGHSIAPGSGALRLSARFDGARSWVEVPRSPSMDDLRQFRAQVTFRIDGDAPTGRQNLVEGFVSFSLSVDGGGAVHFSIVDRAGAWTVCSTPAGAVARDRWHTVVAAHDGVAEARLAVDAAVLGRNTSVLGPVRSVGPVGIAIGRWPDTARFLFKGQISEVALYKFDPEPELTLILGAGCVDSKALEQALNRVSERMGNERLVAWAERLVEVTLEAAQALGHGADDTDALRMLNYRALTALGSRDRAGFTRAIAALARRARARLSAEEQARITERYTAVRDEIGLTPAEVRELAKALCLEGMAPVRPRPRRARR